MPSNSEAYDMTIRDLVDSQAAQREILVFNDADDIVRSWEIIINVLPIDVTCVACTNVAAVQDGQTTNTEINKPMLIVAHNTQYLVHKTS